jgi:hypothetical protein
VWQKKPRNRLSGAKKTTNSRIPVLIGLVPFRVSA